MKQTWLILALPALLLLYGCGAVGMLEEENTDLRRQVDSLTAVQKQMKGRVQYLEGENISLDDHNQQLKTRIKESGALPPAEYTITEEKAAIVIAPSAVPLQQVQKEALEKKTDAQEAQPEPPPQPKSAPWRAERYAIQSGAVNPPDDANGNWYYSSSEPQADAQTQEESAHRGWKGSAQTQEPETWNYGSSNTEAPKSNYAQTFDQKSAARTNPAYTDRQPANRWNSTQREPVTQQAPQYVPQESVPVQTAPQTEHTAVLPPRKNIRPADAARQAEYTFLAAYQRGYDAYKKGQYRDAIQTLYNLSATDEVNNMSDNCDFWIAESYRALQEPGVAEAYYLRVLSFPGSDKAADARSRLAQ